MVSSLRRSRLTLALPALVGLSTLAHWVAGRRVPGLWIMPDEAIYAERAIALWRHGSLPLLQGAGAGYGILYPVLAGFPLEHGSIETGYASLKLLQALAMSLVAAPIFFYGRRYMRPAYALLAAVLALCSPLLLYSGFVMTEVLIYPLGTLALLASARAVETASLRHQLVALAVIAAAALTRMQAVVLLAVFGAAAFAGSGGRRRRFWPLWLTLSLAAVTVVAYPGILGAYAGTVSAGYPVGAAARLTAEHLAYLTLATGVVPVFAMAMVLAQVRDDARILALVATCAVALVVVQVGFFSARYAPHLLGRDLALLPPMLFLVFSLWLDRGAPRPAKVALPVAVALLALLLLTPWAHLISPVALPDTFEIAAFRGVHGTALSVLVGVVCLLLLAVALFVPVRAGVTLALAIAGALIASSVVAARDVAAQASYDQVQLVGEPHSWIDVGSHGNDVTYVYDGETYWAGVWQAQFWNASVTDVLSLDPSRVPGPIEQRVTHVPADGRLPLRTRYVVATDPHEFAGSRVAHVAQPGQDIGGSTLWRLDEPRLLSFRRGIQANGDMTEPGRIHVYDCAGGSLALTLLPKSTATVTIRLDGRVVQRAAIGGLDYWNGTVFVPPSPAPRACSFEIDGQQLLGSTRIEFVRR